MQIVRASSLSAGLGLDAAEGAVTRQAETPSASRAVIRLVPSGRVGSTQAPSPAATRAQATAHGSALSAATESAQLRAANVERRAHPGWVRPPARYPPGPGSPAELKNEIFSATAVEGGPAQLCTSS